ncbi:MAG: PilZ domain-containing protein [Pseudomonadota bacterium]
MAQRSPLRAYHDAEDMRAMDRSYIELEAFYDTDGGDPVRCVISNISPMGALVSFSDASSAPDQITLRVPEIEMVFRADVKWRDGNSIGVRFTKSESL